MNLSEYIRQIGPTRFAAEVGVTERAAISWLYKARRPRMEIAARIVEKTPVTWAGINEMHENTEKTRANA